MKTYSLPPAPVNLLFDIDLTLYRHQEYYDSQIQNQILLLAEEWGRPAVELEKEIQEWDLNYRKTHGGKKTSFGNILHGLYGVTIARSAQLRREALKPEAYLVSDPKLRSTLMDLGRRFSLWCLTNNAAEIGQRTLKVLGVEDLIPGVTGLDHTGYSKPHRECFLKALEMSGFRWDNTISIGDRYDVDIAPALELGMGGILVESMEDVYALPSFLGKS